MLPWFTDAIASLAGFSATAPSDSADQPCPLHPKVTVIGREKEVYDELGDVKAFGKPYDTQGVYRWTVDTLGCRLTPSSNGDRVDVSVDAPCTVRLKVTYAIGDHVSEPAYHTIKFVAHPVYVVGGGSAGLIAAARLLKLGYKVVLCEATGRLGGRARTIDLGDFKADLGCQWLHGDEWRWEIEDAHVPNLGFRADDQRHVYPQVDAIWPWSEDLAVAGDLVETGGAEQDDRPASVHVPPWGAVRQKATERLTDIYESRRGNEASAVAQKRARQGVGVDEVRAEATALAKKSYATVGPAQFAAAARQQLGFGADAELAQEDQAALRQRRGELADAERAKRNLAFDTLGDKDERVRGQEKAARDKLERAKADELRGAAEAAFEEAHPLRDLTTACELAYTIARAKEGPLEEAAEWDAFCNVDREGAGSDDEQDEEKDDGSDREDEPRGVVVLAAAAARPRQQSQSNAWHLGGYGDLLERYAAYLQQTHRGKLWVRLSTRVSNVVYAGGEPVRLTVAGQRERASAVVVTVSTGVINARRLTFEGPSAAEVRAAYAWLPMGNYKKVVLRLARAVDCAAVAGARDAATHRGTEHGGTGTSTTAAGSGSSSCRTSIGPSSSRSSAATSRRSSTRARPRRTPPWPPSWPRVAAPRRRRRSPRTSSRPGWPSRSSSAPTRTPPPEAEAPARALIAQPLAPYGVVLAGEALFVPSYGTAHGALMTGQRAAERVDKTLPRRVFDSAANMD